MPKRVPTIAITVIRDGKRVTPTPNAKAFDFTAEEIASVTAQHPSAFRKPINEMADVATAETAPEKTVKATAATANKVPAKVKAGQKAAAVAAKPDPVVEDAADEADEDAETETETDAADDAAGEDDDI